MNRFKPIFWYAWFSIVLAFFILIIVFQQKEIEGFKAKIENLEQVIYTQKDCPPSP